MDRLDVVAIGIEHERRIVGRVIGAQARRAVVAAAGRKRGLLESVHRIAISRLERQVDTSSELAQRLLAAHAGDEQLVEPEILRRLAAQRDAEHAEYRAVEAL